jgi:hypothetical protein
MLQKKKQVKSVRDVGGREHKIAGRFLHATRSCNYWRGKRKDENGDTTHAHIALNDCTGRFLKIEE